MQRYRIRIAYNGKQFSGWQIQKSTQIPTIQSVVQDAFSSVLNEKITVQGASRTDAGVHAKGQIAHMTTLSPIDTYRTLTRVNILLAPYIVLCEITPVSLLFHAQHHTRKKYYIYSFWNNKDYILPQYYDFTWHVHSINLNLMRESVSYLLGEHDFSVFQNRGSSIVSTIRTLYSIDIIQGTEKELIEIHISGNGFLKQMVRNIVGLLFYIGREKIPISFLDTHFFLKKRKDLPSPTAPAKGLSLHYIQYDEDFSK